MQQLTMVFEPGLSQLHRNLRECVAVGVHRNGLVRVAGLIDSSPSHLSEKLAGVDSSGRTRGLSVDELERYIEQTGDLSPIHYLIDRFMRSPESRQQEAQMRLAEKLPEIASLLSAAGFLPQVAAPKRKRARA